VAAHIDRALASFYRGERGRLALAVTWNFLGWLTGVLEVWLILYFLQATVSIGRAVVIEAFGTSISFATFFLPVQLGIDEGGAVATFVALGMSAATGMSLSLVRRVREMAWIGIGLLILNTRPRTRVATVATRRAWGMCGIGGFVAPANRRAERAVLEHMVAALRHRGPDTIGYHVRGRVALGVARLRVIDLETGDQPFGTEDGSATVVL